MQARGESGLRRDLVALVFGVGVGTQMAGTLVIAGLKAGITPGVSPLVILVAWGLFARLSHGGAGTRFLNLVQVSGSAGMAVTSGVIFTAPVVQILYAELGLEVPPVDVPTLILLSVAGSLIGFGFVGLATKKFLTDPTLPAPEARACETMIESAAAERAARPRMGRSLFLGLAASFLAQLLQALGLASEQVRLLGRESAGVPVGGDPRVLELDPKKRRGQVASIVLGALLLVGWLFAAKGFDTFTFAMSSGVLVMSGVMVTLGAILSLQIGSSASPVSGTIFVTTLVLCLIALATGHRAPQDVLVLMPLIVAACVAVCAANDSSQDYKTLQLCGVRVQDGFLA